MNKNKIEEAEELLSEALDSGKKVYEREVFLSEFERVKQKHGFEFELEEDADLDEVYEKFNEHVNMSASELQKWSKNPCSREASVDPVAVIKRNLRLLKKNKDDWTSSDVEDAQRTVSFVSRMRPNKPDSPREGPHGCPSEWAISLLNWAYNPFDSVPSPSSEVKEDLDPVEKVSLSTDLSDHHDYEFAPVPDQVLYSSEELALERAEDMGLSGVHEHVIVIDGEEETMYMPGTEHSDWAEKVRHPRQLEMSEKRQASQIIHGDQEKHLNKKQQEDDTVSVPPVAIHKVENGSNVKVSDDVEDALDELWSDNEE